MPSPTPPQGFFGDLTNLLPDIDLTKLLPPVVADAIKDTVGSILGDEPGSPDIGDPQPEGERPIPVEPNSKELNGAVKAIDSVVGALEAALKFGFLIPDKYEDVIRKLVGALKTVRGWLD
jgi:hypothetical protein